MSHGNRKKLFGDECQDCGSMPIYADNGIYLLSGRSKTENQRIIPEKFLELKSFLTDNGLAVNDGKTRLTEFMLMQKKAKL